MFDALLHDILIIIVGFTFLSLLAALPWVLLSFLLQVAGFHKASRFVDKVFHIAIYTIGAIIAAFSISARSAAPRR